MKKLTGNFADVELNPKLVLSAQWVSLMLLYIYGDILSFFRPGELEHMMLGNMGPLDANQTNLLIAAVLMVIPAMMVTLSLILNARISRIINLVGGSLFLLVNIGNLVGESWLYYLTFGAVEITVTLMILKTAWLWPKATNTASAV